MINTLYNNRKMLLGYLLVVAFAMPILTLATLWYPANNNDIQMWSVIANTENPLKFLVGDWGHDRYSYRPISSLMYWVEYGLFGVDQTVTAMINAGLHTTTALIMYRLFKKWQLPLWTSIFTVLLFMYSIFTSSPLTWMTDRPGIFAGLFFALAAYVFWKDIDVNATNYTDIFETANYRKNWPWIALISVLALMSKENGLVIPMTFAVFCGIDFKRKRLRFTDPYAISASIIIVGYVIFRFVIFGENATAGDIFHESGYLFGVTYYENWAKLPGVWSRLAVADTIIKHVIAPYAPIFMSQGGFLYHEAFKDLVPKALTFILTVMITGLTLRHKQRNVSLFMFLVIVMNAIVHYSEFRDRTVYLGHMAFVMWLAATNVTLKRPLLWRNYVLIPALALFSMLFVTRGLAAQVVTNFYEIQEHSLVNILDPKDPLLDWDLVQEVLDHYQY